MLWESFSSGFDLLPFAVAILSSPSRCVSLCLCLCASCINLALAMHVYFSTFICFLRGFAVFTCWTHGKFPGIDLFILLLTVFTLKRCFLRILVDWWLLLPLLNLHKSLFQLSSKLCKARGNQKLLTFVEVTRKLISIKFSWLKTPRLWSATWNHLERIKCDLFIHKKPF